ncbi:MAG: DUF5681 domain-containing protein [Pseudomonadota bacterium]
MAERSKDLQRKPGQFLKGQSGNPKGRSRGKAAPERKGSAFDVVVDRTLTVMKRGVAHHVTAEEGLQHKTYQQAVAGERAAQREVLRWIVKYEEAKAKRTPPKPRNIEQKMERDPDNANEALVLLGLARRYSLEPDHPYTRLKLEAWATQAALKRRRGGATLSKGEIEEIKRSTWDPETLVWPRGTET